jgi:FtsH-binding integral membrane protein
MSLEPEGGQPLQFETAVLDAPAEAASRPGVTCSLCQRAIADEYFEVNGQSVCETCREQVLEQTTTPTGFGVFGRAAAFGVGAAVLGALLYYAVIAITNLEIGLIAIAIGYMVGYAVRRGTGGRGGRRFQILAVALTYWAVGLAYTPVLFSQLANQPADQANQQTGTPGTGVHAPGSGSTSGQPTAGEPSSTNGAPLGMGDLLVLLGIVFGLSLALPVLMVVGSLPGGLISAAIIAFGMQQAWRMTGVPQLVIGGPYRIAPTVAPA